MYNENAGVRSGGRFFSSISGSSVGQLSLARSLCSLEIAGDAEVLPFRQMGFGSLYCARRDARIGETTKPGLTPEACVDLNVPLKARTALCSSILLLAPRLDRFSRETLQIAKGRARCVYSGLRTPVRTPIFLASRTIEQDRVVTSRSKPAVGRGRHGYLPAEPARSDR